jgi:hypothetical protein
MTFEERLRARRAQIRAQLESVDVTLLPYYGSARDRIIRPDRALILRSYFIERWLPRLSGDELKVLVVLRNLARVHGLEAENPAVEITVRHLVDLTGISRGTLNRLLAADHLRESPLGRFVQKQAQRVPGIIGTIQGPNLYHVRMDDPIAPEDEPVLREALADLEMERRYSALLSDETLLREPAQDEPEAVPPSAPQPESLPETQPEAQFAQQPVSPPATAAVPRSASQAVPLRRRGSVSHPEPQPRRPATEPAAPNVGHINAAQRMLTNVPNVAPERHFAPAEALPRDIVQAQRDLHARRLARGFNDVDSMGWYRRVVERFMAAGYEDLLHGAARDVLELPEERIKTTRGRVFTDRVKRLARERNSDLGRDDPGTD